MTYACDLIRKEILTSKLSLKVVADTVSTNLNATTNTTIEISNDLLTVCFNRPHPGIISNTTPLNELADYASLDTQTDECDDILSYRKVYAKTFSTLPVIVLNLHSMLTTNTIIARLFSKITVPDRRTRLAPEKLNNITSTKKYTDIKTKV